MDREPEMKKIEIGSGIAPRKFSVKFLATKKKKIKTS